MIRVPGRLGRLKFTSATSAQVFATPHSKYAKGKSLAFPNAAKQA